MTNHMGRETTEVRYENKNKKRIVLTNKHKQVLSLIRGIFKSRNKNCQDILTNSY